VLTKDSILTLAEIVIIDPMRVDLLPDLAQLKDFPPLMQLKLGKGVITINTPLIIIIKVFGCLYKHANVFLHDYANAIWNLKGPEGSSSFHFSHFSSSKSFNHITKDANILHLKLNDNNWFSYFLTSTPLGHTSHHHDQPMVSRWFLTWKNMANLLQGVSSKHGEILTFTLSQLDVL
jgi:hypothetical protein